MLKIFKKRQIKKFRNMMVEYHQKAWRITQEMDQYEKDDPMMKILKDEYFEDCRVVNDCAEILMRLEGKIPENIFEYYRD